MCQPKSDELTCRLEQLFTAWKDELKHWEEEPTGIRLLMFEHLRELGCEMLVQATRRVTLSNQIATYRDNYLEAVQILSELAGVLSHVVKLRRT